MYQHTLSSTPVDWFLFQLPRRTLTLDMNNLFWKQNHTNFQLFILSLLVVGLTPQQWSDNKNSDPSFRSQEVTNKHLPPTSALQFTPTATQQTPSSLTLPVQPTVPTALPQLQPNSAASIMDQGPSPYPLFPPGLIPDMVRKMQIGSGVPYSPLSTLDIPTVIAPSTVSPSKILDRVSKFFKEIGEINPSEGPIRHSASDDEYDEHGMEPPARKGGACIPPPNLKVDAETGAYADGSVDRKAGSGGSGRLGLGATADPNEVSQYDDVYTSYRKQRSTNYHSSMSARAASK
ncbi:hypothetical protein BHE74_00044205 [Ensete ventricosum]|nr:hypothetical protein BHE74_00044205 [Ensete ventricosum]